MNDDFYVVGIGASAGGLDAIQVLFDNMPNNTGSAFVIVQHLSPNFKSMMDELMAKHTQMPIKFAQDGIELKPNHIYLNPREKNIICKEGRIVHVEKDTEHPLNLPIDLFFHSIGNEYENKAVGIILSGTGTDGSRGISTIKGAGGIVIVQEPDTAQFNGMPMAAINSNNAEFVLPPESIGDVLNRIISKTPLAISDEEMKEKQRNSIYFKIINTLFKKSGIDFKLYKNATLLRRIEKRVAINQYESTEEYYAYLNGNEKEQEILIKDLLIGVTGFFRDKEAFNAVKSKILPNLFKNITTKDTIRVWVSACSTGEEAYSLAILMSEYLSNNHLYANFKIFATDIDRDSINTASTGRYPINHMTDIPAGYLERYFIKKGDFFEVQKKVREKIIFSQHNILKDPPFIKMDFISCRNFLIYMLPKAQSRIINMFHFGLSKGGYLFLGHSENIGNGAEVFSPVDATWRIYKSISDDKKLPARFHSDHRQLNIPERLERSPEIQYDEQYNSKESFYVNTMVDSFAPSCIFIDKNYRILYVNGDVNEYIKIIPGISQNNLLNMLVDNNLSAMIRNGVRRVFEEQKKIYFNDISYKYKNKTYSVNLGFEKVVNPNSNVEQVLIVFEKNNVSSGDAIVYDQYKLDEFSKQRIDDLENELKDSRQELQKTVEQLETSNEELQASNEELQASNEELQSTNEELQSVNEELYTVNAELQGKNKDLADLNNDYNNLMDSTEIGILFLDNNLRIRKFTPSLKLHFHLTERDIGRPISNFAASFSERVRKEFISDSKKSLKSGEVIEKMFKDDFGQYFLRKTSPFSEGGKTITGVVISLVNITRLKKNELALKQSEAKFKKLYAELERIIENFPGLIYYKDLNNKFIRVNKSFADLHQMSAKELVGKKCETIYPADHAKAYHEDDLEVAKSNKPKLHIIEPLHTSEGCYWVSTSKMPLKDIQGNTIGVIAISVDITELKIKMMLLEQSEKRLKQTQEIAHVGAWEMDLETGKSSLSDEFYRICGFEPGDPELTDDKLNRIVHPDDKKRSKKAMDDAIKNNKEYELEKRIITANDKIRYVLSKGRILMDDDNRASKFVRSFIDITNQKATELSLRKSEEKFRNLFDTMVQGVIYQDNKGEITAANAAAEEILGRSFNEMRGKSSLDSSWNVIREDGTPFPGESLPAMISLTTGKEVKNVIMGVFNHKQDTFKWLNVNTKPLFEPGSSKPVQVYATLEDITERYVAQQKLKQQTNKLIQSEKINAIGTLIAGVAHELNNPLMGVMNYANYIKKHIPSDNKVHPVIEDLLEEAERSAEIVKSLLTFSRKEDQKDNKTYATDIPRVIHNAMKIIKLKTKRQDITITFSKADSNNNNISPCNISLGYAQQVFFNILDNAVSAVKDEKNREIKIDIDENEHDDFVGVVISDTGFGMDEETIARIFDPFYTTKEVGQGTGLGLSICKNIMDEIGGKISVKSIPDKGTTFKLKFPVTKQMNIA